MGHHKISHPTRSQGFPLTWLSGRCASLALPELSIFQKSPEIWVFAKTLPFQMLHSKKWGFGCQVTDFIGASSWSGSSWETPHQCFSLTSMFLSHIDDFLISPFLFSKINKTCHQVRKNGNMLWGPQGFCHPFPFDVPYS